MVTRQQTTILIDPQSRKLLEQLVELENYQDLGTRPTAEHAMYTCDSIAKHGVLLLKLKQLHPNDYQTLIEQQKKY